MKLYKTTYYTDAVLSNGHRTTKTQWHSSAGDASKARTKLKANDRNCNPTTEEVEVTTTRSELIAFLNNLTGPQPE